LIRQLSGASDVSTASSCNFYQEFTTDRDHVSEKAKEQKESNQLPKIMQNYLHITAMAVQLHFPDITDVTLDMLIENVQSSPFYLYYDLMMNYMRTVKRELAEKAARKEAPLQLRRKAKSAPEQSNFLTRFFRLKQGKDTSAGSKQSKNENGLYEVHSPLLQPVSLSSREIKM